MHLTVVKHNMCRLEVATTAVRVYLSPAIFTPPPQMHNWFYKMKFYERYVEKKILYGNSFTPLIKLYIINEQNAEII